MAEVKELGVVTGRSSMTWYDSLPCDPKHPAIMLELTDFVNRTGWRERQTLRLDCTSHQMNAWDCGVFVLYRMRMLTQGSTDPVTQADISVFRDELKRVFKTYSVGACVDSRTGCRKRTMPPVRDTDHFFVGADGPSSHAVDVEAPSSFRPIGTLEETIKSLRERRVTGRLCCSLFGRVCTRRTMGSLQQEVPSSRCCTRYSTH